MEAPSAMEVDAECGPASTTTPVKGIKDEQGEAAPKEPVDLWTRIDLIGKTPRPIHPQSTPPIDSHNSTTDESMSAPQDRTPDITSRTEAANEGDADAQFALGLAYFEGEDVVKNLPKAAKCFRKAADQSFKDAQYKLGWMYFSDQGVPRDQTKAAKLFLKAAHQGRKQALFDLGSMYQTGDGAQQSFLNAAKWWTMAAEQGDPVAQFNIAVMCCDGAGVPQNKSKAIEWHLKSASQGHKEVQYFLGRGSSSGHGQSGRVVDKGSQSGTHDRPEQLGRHIRGWGGCSNGCVLGCRMVDNGRGPVQFG